MVTRPRPKPVIKPRARAASPGARGFAPSGGRAPSAGPSAPSKKKFQPSSIAFKSLPKSVQERLASEGKVEGKEPVVEQQKEVRQVPLTLRGHVKQGGLQVTKQPSQDLRQQIQKRLFEKQGFTVTKKEGQLFISKEIDRSKQIREQYGPPTKEGLVSEFKPTPEQKIKRFVEKRQGTIGGIAAGVGFAGFRFAKGFALGVTAPIRPKFYTQEIPSLFKLGGRLITGKGAPEIGRAIREDPAVLFEIAGFGKGVRTVTTVGAKAVTKVRTIRFESKIALRPEQRVHALVMERGVPYKVAQPTISKPKVQLSKPKIEVQTKFRKDLISKVPKPKTEPGVVRREFIQAKILRKPFKPLPQPSFQRVTESGKRISSVPVETQYRFFTPKPGKGIPKGSIVKKTPSEIRKSVSKIPRGEPRRRALDTFLRGKKGHRSLLFEPTFKRPQTRFQKPSKLEQVVTKEIPKITTKRRPIIGPIVGLGTIGVLSLIPAQKVTPTPIQDIARIPKTIPDVIQIPKAKVAAIPKTKPDVIQVPKSFIRTVPGFDIPRTPTKPTPRAPPIRPPKIIKLPEPRQIKIKKKKKKPKRIRDLQVFNPSLVASALKITGPQPLILTGIATRPIPIGRLRERGLRL